MRRLILMRHGKSSWGDAALADFDRPLAEKGKKDVALMAKKLQEIEPQIDKIILSTANRAQMTAKIITTLYDAQTLKQEDRIYEASTETLFRLVQTLDDAWERVLFVGHNPGFSDLANYFSREPVSMSTSSIVVLSFDTEQWLSVTSENLVDENYIYPKQFKI